MKIINLYYKTKSFSLENINLEINKEKYFILLGPSGSGKTTLAKCICGLYKINSGKIFINDKDISNLPPEERNIGYVPQNYALFPNMNVYHNLLFSAKIKNIDFNLIKNKFDFLINQLNIKDLLDRDVFNLSGGEKQRIALARALLAGPKVLILDEPFSAIDTGLKISLWFDLKEFLNQLNIPIIHITHNLDEAAVLSDKIAVIINGKIMQTGNSNDILLKPVNEKIAEYLGIKNIFKGVVKKTENNKIYIRVKGTNNYIVALNEQNIKENEKIKISIREQDIKIIKQGYPIKDELKDNIFDVIIERIYFLSDTCIIKLKSTLNFQIKVPIFIYKRYKLFEGEKIKIGLWQPAINIFKD